MAKRREVLTTDSYPLPPIDPGVHDVTAAIHLLEWARSRGWAIGPLLHVGNVKMQVQDIRQARREGDPVQREAGLYDGLDESEPGTD